MPRKMAVKVMLIDEERKELSELVKQWSLCPTLVARCQILLAADANKDIDRRTLSHITGTSASTVTTVLKQYAEGGVPLVTTLRRNEASDIARLKVDGRTEAIVIAKACSPPPSGHCKWTLRLLATKVEQDYDMSLSKDAIRAALNRNDLKPHLNDYWCIPPKEDAEFVAHMEDVLDVYERPPDPDYPLVCIDEKSYQLLDEVRKPIPMIPGHNAIQDSEYKRMGTCSIFMVNAPHVGFRRVFLNRTRTATDFAQVIRYLNDELYPDAKRIVLVMDNLNTHCAASLYKTFRPAEARRLLQRLEIHYTPKHGSWLDMAEIELNALTRQCLNRRIPNIEMLASEIAAWEKERNDLKCQIDWQFTNSKARTKLKSLYPKLIPLEEGAPYPVPASDFAGVSRPEQYVKPEPST